MTPKNKYPSQSQKPPKTTQMKLSNVRIGTVYTTCATAVPRCSSYGALTSQCAQRAPGQRHRKARLEARALDPESGGCALDR